MANKDNLIPLNKRAKSVQREIQSKGGMAKAKKEKEKKIVQRLLEDYLNEDVKSNKNLKKIAEAAGVKETQSIKELVVAVCILNAFEKGDVRDLEILQRIMGEDNRVEQLEDISEAEAEIFSNNQYY